MDTDGGGWTVIYAATGATGQQNLVSDTAMSGNPLVFQAYNLPNKLKGLVDSYGTETLFKKNNGQWIKANKNLDLAKVHFPNFDKESLVTITARNGATDPTSIMGWVNFNM
jgi:hypothetical protein